MSSQHFLSAFQRKHHISLKQVKISLKTLFSVSEIPKNFTLCNYFLFQRLSRTICLAFFEKIIFDNMRPPYDVLNLYHVIRLNWSNFLNRPRARARALASFASYIAYSLGLIIARGRCVSGWRHQPRRHGKTQGKASKTQIHAKSQKRLDTQRRRPLWVLAPCVSYWPVPGFQKFFFLAWADVRREMCAECTKATKLFAPAFWGPGQYKDLLQNRKPRMLCIQCRHDMGRHLREQS